MKNISVEYYKLDGSKEKNIEIKTKYNDLKLNHNLLNQAILSYLANKKQVSAHTKSRAEVSGGGKKPFRQKGTGMARTGSIRTPLHIGGGIVFGPKTNKNVKLSLNKNAKHKALALVLNEKSIQKEIICIPEINIKEYSTKKALSNLSKIPLKDGNILLIINEKNNFIYKSFKNVSDVNVKVANGINSLDILIHDMIVITKDSADTISKQLAKK